MEEGFTHTSQKRLIRLTFNHFSIMLEGGCIQKGRCPFRLKNMWLKADGFVEKVHNWRGSYQFVGSYSFVLANKLKILKGDLKKWNEEEFGHVTLKKKKPSDG